MGRIVEKHVLKARSAKKVNWKAVSKEFNKMAMKKLVKGQEYDVSKISARAWKDPKTKSSPTSEKSSESSKHDDKSKKGRKPQTDKVKESENYVPRSKSGIKNQTYRFELV